MKNILITGAYGGMGYATAKALSDHGYTVFALDKQVRDAESRVLPVQADITDAESVRRAFECVSAQADELFAIIHFAGIYRLDSLVEMSEDRFVEIFNVNLFGAYRVTKTFLPLLRKGSRVLVTTSELAPLSPLPFTGIYAVTKSALEKYAASLRMELQLLGVSVSVIRPGAVKTGLLSTSTAELKRFCENTRLYTCNADRFRRIVNRVEAKSVATEVVAHTVIKALTSQRPRYVYTVNRNPLLRLLDALPLRWQTAVIGRILKA